MLSLFKRSHCQLTNVVTIQGCIPCFFVIEKVSGFSHLPEGTIVVQRTFHAATLAFALKIIKQCSKLTVLICVFSSVNSDEWHCYQLFLDFRYITLSWLPWLKFLTYYKRLLLGAGSLSLIWSDSKANIFVWKKMHWIPFSEEITAIYPHPIFFSMIFHRCLLKEYFAGAFRYKGVINISNRGDLLF